MSGKGHSVERVEMDKTVAARREDSGERRQAQTTAKEKLAAKQRRAEREQSQLESLLKRKEEAWREKEEAYREELNNAAEENLLLDKRNKQGSLVKTVMSVVIASCTALGSAGIWAYTSMQEAAQEKAKEENRRTQVQEALDADRAAISTLSADLEGHQTKQKNVNLEQQKVNTMQLLRGQRVEIMMETMLRRQGRTPPKKNEQYESAECAAGLRDPSECKP